jgi:hypothetical protein
MKALVAGVVCGSWLEMSNASWYLELKQEQTTQTFLQRTLPMTRIYSNFARLFRMPYTNDPLHRKMFSMVSGHVATKVMLQKPSICHWGASKVGYSPISTSVFYLSVLDQVRHN